MTISVPTLLDSEARHGACPHCQTTSGYVTLGCSYYLTCVTHSVYWHVGDGLDWPRLDATLGETAATALWLDTMKPTVPVYPLPTRAAPATQRAAA